ncbi:MAG: hypothetical protein ABFC84_02520 [Veillonellales bacterium]
MSFEDIKDIVNQGLGNIEKTGQAIVDSIRERVPTELGQDQIADLGSEPEVPQVAVYVPETYDQVSNANYGESNFANENQNQTEHPLPEITYYNSSGLKADISGNTIRNSDGTYTDREGHTIMADENGEPIMAQDAPEFYDWYKPEKA